MGRVKIGEHLWINLSRRSLCDNCSVRLCTYNHGERILHCDKFTPALVAFKRCSECGEVFEVTANFCALDYDLCPKCNGVREDKVPAHG
jgi:hypothetical protein